MDYCVAIEFKIVMTRSGIGSPETRKIIRFKKNLIIIIRYVFLFGLLFRQTNEQRNQNELIHYVMGKL